MARNALFVSALLLSGSSVSGEAMASFGSGTDIEGYVKVEAGSVSVSLDLSQFNTSLLPNGSHCFANGLKYHIHESWSYDTSEDRLTSACGAAYTGGHWDPWTACSSSTGNLYCSVNADAANDTDACVPGSASWKSGTLGYSCDSTNFTESPYVCEVGDWSGKYGVLEVGNNLLASTEGASAFEVDSDDLIGKSIVFHCTDDAATRAFCAPFNVTAQRSGKTADSRTTQSESKSQKATLDGLTDSYVVLSNDNTYSVSLDLTGVDLAGCNDVIYRVYTAASPTTPSPTPAHAHVVTSAPTAQARIVNGTVGRRLLQSNGTRSTSAPDVETTSLETTAASTEADATTSTQAPQTTAPAPTAATCADLVGAFYDPTISCMEGSEYADDYCDDAVRKCGDMSYHYNCNASDTFSCAPGDLSGKYGSFNLSKSLVLTASGYDRLMIDLDEVEGMYVVVQCADNADDLTSIFACGMFENDSSHKSKSDGDDDGAAAWWVWLLVALGCVGIIIGGVVLFRYCRNNDNSYTKIQS